MPVRLKVVVDLVIVRFVEGPAVAILSFGWD
jgi:hypothetical protein